MDTTVFLAQIWGPVILAVSLGVFFSRSYYMKIYTNLEQDSLAVLTFGMFAMAAGIAHIGFHNVWGGLTQSIVSFLGWALFVKGLLFIVAPSFVDKSGDWQVGHKTIPYSGIIMLVVGLYLSWIGYFA